MTRIEEKQLVAAAALLVARNVLRSLRKSRAARSR
jgi:hypothetical protein